VNEARSNGRLIGWSSLVGFLIALAYLSRLAGGKPPKNTLYTYAPVVEGVVTYALMLGLVCVIASGAIRELLALRAPRPFGSSAGWALVAILVIAVTSAVLDPLLNPGKEQGLTTNHWEPRHASAYAANFVVIAVVAPVVEELTFRGLGYSLLERFGAPVAIAVVGLTFGLAHGLVLGLPVLVIFGCTLAWLRMRTGSVFPGMVVHALFNAFALIATVAT
jgi:membrane protease YdiL (CAAX protease family)